MHSSLVLSAACGLKPQRSFSSRDLYSWLYSTGSRRKKNETWACQEEKSYIAGISYKWQEMWSFLPILEHGWLEKKSSEKELARLREPWERGRGQFTGQTAWVQRHTIWSKLHFSQGPGIWAFGLASLHCDVDRERELEHGREDGGCFGFVPSSHPSLLLA